MIALQQAFSTTCIPQTDTIDMTIPNEYIGQEIEVIVFVRRKNEQKYNSETFAAMQEAKDIMAGKIKAKSYTTAEEMHSDILSEEDD